MSLATCHEISTTAYQGACRRDYFRVTSWLPVRLTGLNHEEATKLTLELNLPAEESASLADHQVEARLCQIEHKLDLLLERAGFDVALPLSQTQKREVELSGSGIRVEADENYRVGDLVKVELYLPEERGRSICLLGRIITGNDERSQDSKLGVALVFQTIRDRDREAIVRHAYEVQRLSLGRAARRDHLR